MPVQLINSRLWNAQYYQKAHQSITVKITNITKPNDAAKTASRLNFRIRLWYSAAQSVGFHIPLKGSDDGVHPFYNGESVAIRTWLTERAKLNPPDEVEEFFISERRKALSRVTVWLMVKQVAAGAGLEALDVHPHSLIRFSWAIFARK